MKSLLRTIVFFLFTIVAVGTKAQQISLTTNGTFISEIYLFDGNMSTISGTVDEYLATSDAEIYLTISEIDIVESISIHVQYFFDGWITVNAKSEEGEYREVIVDDPYGSDVTLKRQK